jgi:hypothetical protein
MSQLKWWNGSAWENVKSSGAGSRGATGPTGATATTSVSSPLINSGTSTSAQLSFSPTAKLTRTMWGHVKYQTGQKYGTPTNLATSNVNSGTITFVPFLVNETITAVSLSVYVNSLAVGGTMQLGIYSSSSTKDTATTLVLDAGSVSTASTGAKTISISQSLTPGLYWLAALPLTATPSMAAFVRQSALPFVPAPKLANIFAGWAWVRTAQTSLPSTVTTALLANTSSTYVWVGF